LCPSFSLTSALRWIDWWRADLEKGPGPFPLESL